MFEIKFTSTAAFAALAREMVLAHRAARFWALRAAAKQVQK